MGSANLLEAMQEPLEDFSMMSHEQCYVNKTLRMFVRNLHMAIGGLPKLVKYEAGPKLMSAVEDLQDACTDAYTAETAQEQYQRIVEAIHKARHLSNRLRNAADGNFFPREFFVYHFSLCESIINQLKNWRNKKATDLSTQVSLPGADLTALFAGNSGVA